MEIAILVVVKEVVRHVMNRCRIVVTIASVMGESVEHDDLVVEVIPAVTEGDIVGTSVLSQEDDTVASAADVRKND
jgi:uncharacterized spore protein YtfJ